MRLVFHPGAEADLGSAIDYFESRERGLGYDFLIDVHSAIDRIMSFPDAWAPLEGGIRRCQTVRFPFGIIYAVEGDQVVILAVMHLHRDPDSWRSRLG